MFATCGLIVKLVPSTALPDDGVAFTTLLFSTAHKIHVILFYIFGFCGIGFFISNVICHRQSLYYLNPYVSSLEVCFNIMFTEF
ncbi:unnamed protein product [Gongylonema pulchrum]|uniref:Secreted protein n=1 Tax=Gongylonema pulchrum TaxID=637853 RepID=A0A183ECX9_9BILA|nr:unnamed protein product [Gongylonema pulchrum]